MVVFAEVEDNYTEGAKIYIARYGTVPLIGWPKAMVECIGI